MQFNEYLRSCREHYHLTQEQLVQELYNFDDIFEGLDTGTLSRWERGATRPNMDRQIKIIHIFQNRSNEILPCFNAMHKDEIEDKICLVGLHNLIGDNKRLILNMPSHTFEVDAIKVSHVRNSQNLDHLLEMPHALFKGLTDNHLELDQEHLKAWALHPSNLFLVSEYQDQFFGMLFALRLKPDVFNKLIHFEIDHKALSEKDFADFDELGCNYIFAFFAYSDKSAALLLLRYYAHLIANQDVISQVGAVTFTDYGQKTAKRINLNPCHQKREAGVAVSHQAPLQDVLINEAVLKMIFQKQECPEDT